MHARMCPSIYEGTDNIKAADSLQNIAISKGDYLTIWTTNICPLTILLNAFEHHRWKGRNIKCQLLLILSLLLLLLLSLLLLLLVLLLLLLLFLSSLYHYYNRYYHHYHYYYYRQKAN